jgi:hypothetical protein
MPIEHANRGKPPRDASIPLGIRWANGMTAKHTYTAGQLVWEIRGWEYDIATYWRVDGK